MSELAPTLTLLHGAVMPRLGLGTAGPGDAAIERTLVEAIEVGYRSVDTAEAYRNERGVGNGVRASGIAREELFVTTKFQKVWHGRDLVAQAYEGNLERLGLDYVDLLLIHWPNPQQDRYVEAWEGLVGLLEAGRVRAIGTSNFKPSHLERIIAATGVAPDVNQIELSPWHTRESSRAFAAEHGIVTESWSPLGGGGADLLKEPLVVELAETYGRTPAQVVLRWHMDLGLVTVPKASHRDRLRQNLEIFDFSLSAQDVAALSALDRGEAAAVDSDRFGH